MSEVRHLWCPSCVLFQQLLDSSSYVFIFSLFNDAASNVDYVLRSAYVVLNNELPRNWKEAVVARLKVLPRQLRGGTDEDHAKSRVIGGSVEILTGTSVMQLRSVFVRANVVFVIVYSICTSPVLSIQ
jgi:hypothetical protein